MSYELVFGSAEYALVRCPNCGLEARITAPPGPYRLQVWRALNEVRGCECPIGHGGTTAVIPGMKVYRLKTGKKYQVSDVQPKTQQIKVIDPDDHIGRWEDVRLFSKKPIGLALRQARRR